MMFPTRMKQLVAVVLEPDVESVTRSLLKLGVMHFINVRKLVPEHSDRLRDLPQRVSPADVIDLRKRIESFFAVIGERPPIESALDVDALKPVDFEQAKASLDRTADAVQELRNRQSLLHQEALKLDDIRRQAALYSDLRQGVRAGSRFSFLAIQTGTIAKQRAPALETELRGFPSVLLPIGADDGALRRYFLITMRKDEKQVEQILRKCEWQDADITDSLEGIGDEVAASLEARIRALRGEQDVLRDKVRDVIRSQIARLSEMWSDVRLAELMQRIQTHFTRTARTALFTGWIPAARRQEVEKAVRAAGSGRCYLEWRDPPAAAEEEAAGEAPVELRSPGFMAPFQMIVQNYSTPEYGTVNPTPFVAAAYLAMFGLMFGDAGHGLVLMLLGAVGRLLYRKENNVRRLLALLIWCGGASIFAGTLFGSYFGVELLPPIWFGYNAVLSGTAESGAVTSVYDILVVTIYFGIAVITLGLVLNWVNLVAKRRWFRLVFEKGGVLGGLIYGAGVWGGFAFARSGYRALPDPPLLLALIGVPVALLALKAPAERFLHARRHGGRTEPHAPSVIDSFMEWIVEILEIFSGYLANTLSFMRVAGLGIAHEALMIAFLAIANTVGGGKMTAGGVVVLIFGNALVIALEGLSAGIQSLRLNYYEFFSKYFSGTGVAYNPVSLRSRD